MNLVVLCAVPASIVKTLLEYFLGPHPFDEHWCPNCVIINEVYFAAALKAEYHTISLMVISTLMSYAAEIENITSGFNRNNKKGSLRKIEQLNKAVNSQFTGFLAIFYVHYFMHLVGEVPSATASVQCKGGDYFFVQIMSQLYLFVLVIQARAAPFGRCKPKRRVHSVRAAGIRFGS